MGMEVVKAVRYKRDKLANCCFVKKNQDSKNRIRRKRNLYLPVYCKEKGNYTLTLFLFFFLFWTFFNYAIFRCSFDRFILTKLFCYAILTFFLLTTLIFYAILAFFMLTMLFCYAILTFFFVLTTLLCYAILTFFFNFKYAFNFGLLILTTMQMHVKELVARQV